MNYKSKKKNSKRADNNKAWMGYNNSSLALINNKFLANQKIGIFQKFMKMFKKPTTNK